MTANLKSKMIVMLALLGMGVAAPTASAQDFDLDSEKSSSKKKKEPKAVKQKKQQAVREIVKGTYAKSNVGGALYLGNFNGFVKPGTSLGLAIGSDFVDQEKMSAAWEIMFFQGIHNGVTYDQQTELGGPFIQGDIRTYTLAGTLEYSFYASRRIGIGLRAGGGVMFSPLLMEPTYYTEEVLGEWGIGADPGYHGVPHPLGMGGPTFEYYTKLSHFSVGMDTDVFYAVGFDLGASITGTLKYTF